MCLGVPGKVSAKTRWQGHDHGQGRFQRHRQGEVCLAYVPEVTLGDYVVVHVGFAISVVDGVGRRRCSSFCAKWMNW